MKTTIAELVLLGLALILIACGGGGSTRNMNSVVTVSLSATPTLVDLGEIVTLTWSSTNASTCLATSSPAESDWTALLGASGSATVTPATYAGEIYSLTCAASSGPSQGTASVSVSVNSAAAAIANDTPNGASYPSNRWISSNCALNGHPIAGLTIEPATGSAPQGNSSFWICPGTGWGCFPTSGGGYGGQWSATTDGTGMLVTYPQLTSACVARYHFPISVLNIAGDAASGTFSAEFVDGTGANATCSFTLVPLAGPGPAWQQINC
jgi:hypothetical protein